MKIRFLPACLPLVFAGCVPTPPAAPVQRSGTPVAASFGKTWNAVIDQFAERNIPIRTMERASGFIATEPLRVNDAYGDPKLYDCGSIPMGGKIPASDAVYNVLVRGDSTSATVRVTVKWTHIQKEESLTSTLQAGDRIDCTSQGGWENDFESAVKARAEKP